MPPEVRPNHRAPPRCRAHRAAPVHAGHREAWVRRRIIPRAALISRPRAVRAPPSRAPRAVRGSRTAGLVGERAHRGHEIFARRPIEPAARTRAPRRSPPRARLGGELVQLVRRVRRVVSLQLRRAPPEGIRQKMSGPSTAALVERLIWSGWSGVQIRGIPDCAYDLNSVVPGRRIGHSASRGLQKLVQRLGIGAPVGSAARLTWRFRRIGKAQFLHEFSVQDLARTRTARLRQGRSTVRPPRGGVVVFPGNSCPLATAAQFVVFLRPGLGRSPSRIPCGSSRGRLSFEIPAFTTLFRVGLRPIFRFAEDIGHPSPQLVCAARRGTAFPGGANLFSNAFCGCRGCVIGFLLPLACCARRLRPTSRRLQRRRARHSLGHSALCLWR